MTPYPTHRVRPDSGGFTLVEMMVVMAIIVIAIAVMLPAFGRIISSQNFAAAVNTVTATLGNARAEAIGDGESTGVAFLYDAQTERFSLQPLELESNQAFLTDGVPDLLVERQGRAFRPSLDSVPVELPARTGVFGLSFQHIQGPGSFNRKIDKKFDTYQWYAGEIINGQASNPTRHITPWIFPRNDPRLFTDSADPAARLGDDPWAQLTGRAPPGASLSKKEAQRALRHANSFAVFFSIDGTVRPNAFVGGRQYSDAYIEFPDEPFNRSRPDDGPYDDPIRFDPENFGTVPQLDRRPNREVLLRAADMLAVTDLTALASGVGRRQAWLARPVDSRAPQPNWLGSTLGGADLIDDNVVRDVSRWIDLNAEIVGFNRYTGNAIRRTAQ